MTTRAVTPSNNEGHTHTDRTNAHGSTGYLNACQRQEGEVYALNFSAWKRPLVKRFLQNSRVTFIRRASDAPTGSTLVVWGSSTLPEHMESTRTIVRLEDGFLRSVGLGADLVTPLSWVADTQGIYYDASRPSELERLLQNHRFEPALCQRAAALRQNIVSANLSKYNVGTGQWQRPDTAQTVILIPGQVEDDASIRHGAPGIHKNIDLLQAVREANPDAYIVYKPHPDVLAGLRSQGEDEHTASDFCDETVIDTPMPSLLKNIDEVHLMTSLTGFEALLRGIPVTCYGLPFYAGWGLTHDMLPSPRRQASRTLDELTAATLILYPCYTHPKTGEYVSPEHALDLLRKQQGQARPTTPGWGLRIKRKILGYAARKRK